MVDKTVDTDYEDLSEILFGEGNCYSSSEVRKRMYGMKTVIEALDREDRAIADLESTSDINARSYELKKERQKFFDERNALSRLIRERARQEELNEIIVKTIENSDLPTLTYSPAFIGPSDNDLLVSLNDIHYGATVDNYWHTYDSEICRGMVKTYLDKIFAVARTHNSQDCYVWANGDLISGNIHHSITVSNKENVIEQLVGVSELIAEFLSALSKHFQHVYFVSVAGNHSRIDKKDRALPAERLDDLVEWFLKARLQNFENVTIGAGTKIDPSMYLLGIRGKAYLGIHGDYDGSQNKMQALQLMVRTPLYAILSGHLHHNAVKMVQGIKAVMAGSFLGTDDFCVTHRILGRPEQMICVCDKDGIVCHYDAILR